jgi:hypothetical protein
MLRAVTATLGAKMAGKLYIAKVQRRGAKVVLDPMSFFVSKYEVAEAAIRGLAGVRQDDKVLVLEIPKRLHQCFSRHENDDRGAVFHPELKWGERGSLKLITGLMGKLRVIGFAFAPHAELAGNWRRCS